MSTSGNAQISSASPAATLFDADEIDSETFFSGSKLFKNQVFPELDKDFCESVYGLFDFSESGRSQAPDALFREKPEEQPSPEVDASATPVRSKRKASASPETFIRKVRRNMGRYRKGWSKTRVGRAYCAEPEKLQELFFDFCKNDGRTDRAAMERLYNTLTQSIDVDRDGTPIICRGMKLQMLHFGEMPDPSASPCKIISVNHRTKKFVMSVKQNGEHVIEEREWSVYGCFDLVLP